MNASKAIANELEASNIGLNTTQNVTFGEGTEENYILLYSIVSNVGFGGIGKNELVGIRGEINSPTVININNGTLSLRETSFTYGNELKYFYWFGELYKGPNNPIFACANWAKYTNGDFDVFTQVGKMFLLGTNGTIKSCTKSKALTFGCSVQNATSYSDKQLVKYTDLYKNIAGSYKVTIDNSTNYTLLVNGSAVSPQYFNVGASIRLTTNASSNYIVTYKYKIGSSTTYTTFGGSVFTMPDNDVTVTITVSDMSEVHIIQPTGATIKVNGSSDSIQRIKIGTTVTLSETTSSGYTFNGYTFKKTNGNIVSLSNPFTMPSYTVVVSGNTKKDSTGGGGSDPGGGNESEVVVLNVPNTNGARSGWANIGNSPNIVDNVSMFEPAEFVGIFSDEAQLLGNTEAQEALLNQDGLSEFVDNGSVGDLFFQNDSFVAQADVFLVNEFQATVSAYKGTNENANFTSLASVTTNFAGQQTIEFAGGILVVDSEHLANGALLHITYNPKTRSYDELCTLIVIDVSGNYYCIGYQYGFPYNDNRNNQILALSPVYNLLPTVTLDGSTFYPQGLARGYTTSECSIYDNSVHTLVNDPSDNLFYEKEIILQLPYDSLTPIDYSQMYLTVATVKPNFTAIITNTQKCWSIEQGWDFGNECLQMFNQWFVDYVQSNFQNYFEVISDKGFIISFTNLFAFENSDYVAGINWFTSTNRAEQNYALGMNMQTLIAGEPYVYPDYLGYLEQYNAYTLYFSIIYRGHIWAYLYNPYDNRNAGGVTMFECTVNSSYINDAVGHTRFNSNYEPLQLSLDGTAIDCNMLLNYGV